MAYPWLRKSGRTINFIAGPLIQEYGTFKASGKTFQFDAHQQPDHIFVVTIALVPWRDDPWPVRIRTRWLTSEALLLPWGGGYGKPEPNQQLPMGYDNHIYYESYVPKAIDLLVIANSPSEGVEVSRRLIKTNPQIRAILAAIRHEPQPLPLVETPKTFPILDDVKPIW